MYSSSTDGNSISSSSIGCNNNSNSNNTNSSSRTDHFMIGNGFSSLRLYLDERQNAAFAKGGIADVLVSSSNGIHERLTALHRALILHDALVQLIRVATENDGNDEKKDYEHKLVAAIQRALELRLITEKEARHCRFFNAEANRAKHDQGLPF